MRVKFKFLLCLIMAFVVSCNKTTTETDSSDDGTTLEVSFSASITTRATDTAFESGDEISVTAYDENGAIYSYNVLYSYSSSLFSSSSPIKYENSEDKLSFFAVYPYMEVATTNKIDFTVQSDQSTDSGYTQSDLMVSAVASTSSSCPDLTFYHLLTKVIVDLTSEDIDITGHEVTLSLLPSTTYDISALTATASGEYTNITPASNGDNSYKAIVAPQTISANTPFGTATISGVEYALYYSEDIVLGDGEEITLEGVIEDGTITFSEPIIADWGEGEFPSSSSYSANVIYSDGTWEIADYYSMSSAEGSIDALFDGDLSTYFHSDWSNSAPTGSEEQPHWIIIDLKANHVIDEILLAPRGTAASYCNSGYFETSSDYVNWTYVGDFALAASTWQLQSFEVTPTVARFVRVNCTQYYAQLSGFAIAGTYVGESDGTSLSGKCTEIYFAGNSYVTVAGSGRTTPSISYSTSISNWTSSATGSVISSYVYLHSAGEYVLTISASGTSVINVSSGGIDYDVTLEGSSTQEYTVGTFVADEVGYVKIDFQGVSSSASGGSYGQIETLNIYGVNQISYVSDDWSDSVYSSWYWGCRGPSVHMSYTLPSGNTEWFYNEVTVPEGEESLYSYYMACGFGQGYFGMQYNSSSERRVLFSVWSPYETDDPDEIPDDQWVNNTRNGRDVVITEFGSEGSGGQSYLVYPWTSGTTYKFLMHVRPNDDGVSTDYTAYFYATDDSEWRLIASWNRPITSTWYTSPYSFLENFGTSTGYNDRRYLMANQWACSDTGVWTRITKASFTHDATASAGVRLDYQGGLTEDGSLYLRMGGFFTSESDPATTYGTSYTLNYTGAEPDVDFEALAAIPDGE